MASSKQERNSRNRGTVALVYDDLTDVINNVIANGKWLVANKNETVGTEEQ